MPNLTPSPGWECFICAAPSLTTAALVLTVEAEMMSSIRSIEKRQWLVEILPPLPYVSFAATTCAL